MQEDRLFQSLNIQILDALSESIVAIDLEGKIHYWNRAAEQLYQWQAEEVIGMQIMEILPTSAIRKQAKEIMKTLGEGQTWNGKIEVQRKDGSTFLASVSGAPIFNQPGQLIGIMGVARDITVQAKQESDLDLSEQRYRKLFDQVPVGILIADQQGYYLDANNSICKMLGYQREELIGLHAEDIVDPSETEHIDPALDQILAREEYIREWIFKRKDGSRFSAEVVVTMLPDDNLLAVVRDLTEWKKTQQALFESEEKYRALYDNAPLAYQSLDENGHFLDINPTWLNLLGYPRNEVIGAYFADFLHSDWKPHFQKNFAAFKKRGYVHGVQFKIRHQQGHYVDIEFEGCVGYNPDGSFRQTYCVFQNITERKQAEDALRASQERFDLAVRGSHEGIWDWVDVSKDEYWWSDRIYQMLGYQPGEIEPRITTWVEMIHPADKENVLEVLTNHQESDAPYLVEFRMKTKSGDYIWMFERGTSTRDQDGKPIRMAGSVTDITERKLAEQALRESENRFQYAMEATQDGLFDWNLITNKIYYSPGWKSMLGYAYDELPNDFSVWEKLTDPEDVKRSWEMQQELINKQRDRFEIEFKMRHKDGHWVDILSRANAIFDVNDEAVRIVGTHVDITERKQVRAELERHRENLEELVEERTQRLRMTLKAMTGREVRMAELKKVIKKLRTQIEDAGMNPVADDPLLSDHSMGEDQ